MLPGYLTVWAAKYLLTGHHFRPGAYHVGGPVGLVWYYAKHQELRLGQPLTITKANLSVREQALAAARYRYQGVSYTEQLVVSPLVVCTWERTTTAVRELRIVPDACVDVIWSAERLIIAGPDTRARFVTPAPGARSVGVRLRPGVAGAVLRVPASELCDCTPEAAEVLGYEVATRLTEALASGVDTRALLLRAVQERGVQEPDPLVGAAVAALGQPRARVGAVAAELGVSARQLQRLVSAAAGYGPKLLARVLRFRRLQALAPAPLVELALEAGYADQAHMTAEVSLLTGLSPVRFLKDRSPPAA